MQNAKDIINVRDSRPSAEMMDEMVTGDTLEMPDVNEYAFWLSTCDPMLIPGVNTAFWGFGFIFSDHHNNPNRQFSLTAFMVIQFELLTLEH